MKTIDEQALTIECDGSDMVAVAHLPGKARVNGVLIVVGGPQYRGGSHRQFVLLARHLADQGVAVLRFDHRGIGDSEGEDAGFQHLDDDIRCAVDEFFTLCPSMSGVHIWALCDGASAALLYAYKDRRICGLVLLNPWVRTEAGLAKAVVSTYYRQRLRSASLWKDLFSGRLNFWKSGRALAANLTRATLGSRTMRRPTAATPVAAAQEDVSFVDSMLCGFEYFRGRVLVIIAGNDITGGEFRELAKTNRRWKRALDRPQVTLLEVAGADHTFSTREWRNEVEARTSDWVLGQ